jgi:hypothetical protein
MFSVGTYSIQNRNVAAWVNWGPVSFTDSGAIYQDISSMPCNRETESTQFSDLSVCVQNHLGTKADNTLQNVWACLPNILKMRIEESLTVTQFAQYM